MFANTQEFRRAALHYKKHGYYTDAIPGTPQWLEYWRTQKKRCLEGYSVAGTRITGNHYFYLNFYRMLRVEDTADITGVQGQVEKHEDFPAFWDGDYNFFWVLEIAKHGISPEDYAALDLGVTVKDLSGGKNVVVLKARGKGYSYKMASIMTAGFSLRKKYKMYGMADLEEYLTKDGLLNKTWDGVDFIDKNTAWQQPRLVDLMMRKKTGYKRRTPVGYVPDGTQNEIIGVTFRNDPDKARGKRGEFIFWEEGGKFPGLKKSWDIAEDSIRQGRYATGCQVAYGTGGSEEQDFADLGLLFYEPDIHNVIPFENQWDTAIQGHCGFFVPSYQNFEGFIDEHGNSQEEEAKKFIDEVRAKKKQSSDNKAYDHYVANNPYNPQEAMLQSSNNLFPVREIMEHRSRVKAQQLHMKMASHGNLVVGADGLLKFEPDGDAKPITQFPHRSDDPLSGCITVYEPPVKIKGQVPYGLYYLCHDPYAHDTSTSMTSLGASYVIKMPNRFSPTFHGCIVASYVGRPPLQDTYNENMFNLAEYYNARIGFENDRGNVIPYAKQHKKLFMLEEEFEMLYKRELTSNVRRNYGMHVSTPRAEQGEMYIRDWLKTVVNNYQDGSKKLVLHYIYDLALLQELINFNQDGNFDRVKALIVGMYQSKEIQYKKRTSTNTKKHDEFFERELFA